MGWDQILIAVLGVPAGYLAGSVEFATRRWAYVLGLSAQPVWWYTTISNGHWGIFVLSVFYTFTWGRGFYNHWLRRRPGTAPATAADGR